MADEQTETKAEDKPKATSSKSKGPAVKDGPAYKGDRVVVEKGEEPVAVAFRRDLGRLVLADDREVFEKDVTVLAP